MGLRGCWTGSRVPLTLWLDWVGLGLGRVREGDGDVGGRQAARMDGGIIGLRQLNLFRGLRWAFNPSPDPSVNSPLIDSGTKILTLY